MPARSKVRSTTNQQSPAPRRSRISLSSTNAMSVLQALEASPRPYDLSALRYVLVGGSAPPVSLIRALDRYGIRILHAWGMTETSPLGSVARLPVAMADAAEDDQYAYRSTQGRPAPFVE